VRSLVAVVVAVPWVVWAGLRTLGVEVPYPFVAALAFTPYVALTSPIPVVVALLLRRWRVALLAGVAAVGLAVAVVPRAVSGPRPQAGGPTLVVMTSNVWLGSADVNALVRIAQQHDVDVISLQETRWKTFVRLKAIDDYRNRIFQEPLGGGSAILTRLPLTRTDKNEGVLSVEGAPPVRLRAVHPLPPVNAGAAREWRAAIASLPGSDGQGDVRILAGDFNATLDHPEFRRLLARGYRDSGDATGKGLKPTWPALPRRALPITIDHVLVDKRVRPERYEVVEIPHTDHRALIVTLRLPRG